ncbi:DUF5776 domain-containing protein [Lentilactobacillus parabuchneri]|uniref:DUF5776 domain-containing protein n=1 Tax=Lentilactobacillus parabuchneri TaxID=152331 RepID=UPI003CCB313B
MRYHLTTRFVLKNGQYITANRKLVQCTRKRPFGTCSGYIKLKKQGAVGKTLVLSQPLAHLVDMVGTDVDLRLLHQFTCRIVAVIFIPEKFG